RWTYIDPSIAFNPMISFQVVIMALLGGAGSLFGPVLGVVPLVLLFEVLTATLPNHFSIVLGGMFVLIVMALPKGVIGLVEPRLRRAHAGHAATVRRRETWCGQLLVVDGISKSFGGLRAVADVSFEVAPGQIVGVIGPNGSGKTTLLNTLSGAL